MNCPRRAISGLEFAPDGKSLYYARNNKEGTLLFQHVLGTRPSQDVLIFGREFRGEPLGPIDLFGPTITDDGHYLVIQIDRGVPAKRVDIVFRDLTKPGSPFEVLVWGLDSHFNTIYAKGTWFTKTDYNAPNGRSLAADPGVMPDAWKTIVPEGPDVIDDWNIVGGKIYVNRLQGCEDRNHRVRAGRQAGRQDRLRRDRLGFADGGPNDRSLRLLQLRVVHPAADHLPARHDDRQARGLLPAQDSVRHQPVRTEAGLLRIERRNQDSHVHRRQEGPEAGRHGAPADDRLRRLSGQHDARRGIPRYAWWMQEGGWFAMPNLRGGDEYGEHWHEQAMFEKKQNVFDDWFAAAEYLIDNKYTSPEHFAIRGRSNGGLLMGASITQHPELFSAVWCGYPLLDMLRYQKFLVGRYWTTEYGSAENEKQFPYLLKYSPYQNVKADTPYPAIMFFTGDSDTRVDPLHARKMTALMQAASTSGRPILLHYSVSGGHSAGVSVDQQIQDDADELTFLWTETGQPGKSPTKAKSKVEHPE